ncbi:MAG: PhzF family phenazine biosynthesis protein [Rhodobacteraceae bacterium]|nr:PhzF family phenazine biosynthesis protein [Paracoccaceae bacterium]
MEFHTLDVFTDHPFSGNPLAVVLGADGLSSSQMLNIAREFNLSETIFVQKPEGSDHTAKVRIFHPYGELPFAGHPTIGCAILLAEMAHSGDFDVTLTLEETAGLVPVNVSRKGTDISAEFTAPVIPFAFEAGEISDEMAAAALGVTTKDIGFDKHKLNNLQGGPQFLFVPVASRAALSKAQVVNPAFQQLTNAAKHNSVYVYCRDQSGFCARMFAPENGMPEDPATGGASALFAAQLLAAGELNEGSNVFLLKQGEDMGRPSQIGLSVDLASDKITAVKIKGAAVRISNGKITVLPLES